MSYVYYNPNPKGLRVGDCVIRALCKALDKDWDTVFVDLMLEGLALKDMPSSDYVWGSYLYKNGFRRNVIPNDCPNCYSVSDFAYDHPKGLYLLMTSDHDHILAVDNGSIFDTFDSSDEVPVYYWRKELT
jgi:hypothetical protein